MNYYYHIKHKEYSEDIQKENSKSVDVIFGEEKFEARLHWAEVFVVCDADRRPFNVFAKVGLLGQEVRADNNWKYVCKIFLPRDMLNSCSNYNSTLYLTEESEMRFDSGLPDNCESVPYMPVDLPTRSGHGGDIPWICKDGICEGLRVQSFLLESRYLLPAEIRY